MDYSYLTPNTKIKNSVNDINSFLTGISTTEPLENCNVNQATASAEYRLKQYENNTNCYMDYSFSKNPLPISLNSMIDLESELKGINNFGSKCDLNRLKKKSVFVKSTISTELPYCSNFLSAADTRDRKANKATSEILIDRFDFPLDGFNVQSNSVIGVNSRLENKWQIEKNEANNKRVN